MDAHPFQAKYMEMKQKYHQVKGQYDTLTQRQAALYGLIGEELTQQHATTAAKSVVQAAAEAERSIRRLMHKVPET